MDEHILHIVSNKLSGNQLDSDKIELLNNWLKDKNNEATFIELEKVWDLTGRIDYSMTVDVEKEWDAFKAKRDVKPVKSISKFTVFSIAASILLAIGLFIGLSNQSINYQYSHNQNHYLLPDNSKVWLNKDASVEITKQFGKKERLVSLSGEAFFEVQKGSIPFVISTKNGVTVKVLGTSFNVDANNANEVHLHVVTGVVEFGKQENNIAEVVNKGNEATIYTDKNKIITRAIDKNKLSWHTGEFSFNNESLDQVIKMLEDYLLIKIDMPESVMSNRYSGKFNKPTSEDVAEILAQAFGLKFDLNKQSLTFFTE